MSNKEENKNTEDHANKQDPTSLIRFNTITSEKEGKQDLLALATLLEDLNLEHEVYAGDDGEFPDCADDDDFMWYENQGELENQCAACENPP
jgi:hypothetical protein